jgi:hypothetical protein
MSQKHDRPNADGEGTDDQNRSEWKPRCSDFTAASPAGQTPPEEFQIWYTPHLAGFEPIQETTDLASEELSPGYQAAIRRLKEDPSLFFWFEKIAFVQITRLGKTSADKVEGEIRARYGVEFCHSTRTLMGRLLVWKYPHCVGNFSSKKCILDALKSAEKENLILITK